MCVNLLCAGLASLGGGGDGVCRPDPIERQTNAAHMVMCLRQASIGLHYKLPSSDQRRAAKRNSLLKKG